MTTATRPADTSTDDVPIAEEVLLSEVRHGLLDAPGDCEDLDAVLAAARAADTDGAACVVVAAPEADASGPRHCSTTAQALAVLLATERVRVALTVHAGAWDGEAIARFAMTASALSGDRLVVRVTGDGAVELAAVVAAQWDGPLAVVAPG